MQISLLTIRNEGNFNFINKLFKNTKKKLISNQENCVSLSNWWRSAQIAAFCLIYVKVKTCRGNSSLSATFSASVFLKRRAGKAN